MKKFLSLALALVMTMSLVTVSAGAKDFTDDSKITYDEAVSVISEIGVVDGYTDGAFNPQNTLTRGAAAKIICNLVLGPTTASALSADAAPFSDVPATHEFAGYIAYCSQQGIINGYADGTFKPAGTLTGYHFMKMLLGALGYDGEVEGFTGANWTVNVAKLALGVGLDDGNDDFSGNAYVTREEACLYAFNTLKADMVEYDAKTQVSVGGAEVVIAGSKSKVSDQGVYENTMNEKGLQFAEKYFPKLTKTKNDTDPFGRPAAEWKYKSNIIGSYADYSDLQASYTAKAKKGDLFSLIGSSIVDELGAKNGYDFTVYVDGAEVKDPVVSNYFVKSSSAAAGAKDSVKGTGVSGNGVLTEVYMDDDNNVTIVMVNTWLVKATADYNETKGALNVEIVDINTDTDAKTQNVIQAPALTTSIDNDDVYVADFKEDDYILVTYSYTDKEIKSAVKAELVTGEVSEFTETDNVIMDGTTYKYNKLVGNTESDVEYTIGADAKVVLDAYGYIIYVDEAQSTSSYVFVKEAAQATGVGSKVAGDAYFTDGTNDSVIIKKVDGDSDRGSKEGAAGSWWTFSKDSSDQYALTSPKTPRIESKETFETKNETLTVNDKVQFMPNATDKYASGTKDNKAIKGNSSTIFVVLEANGDVTTYTGIANAPEIKTSSSNKGVTVTTVVKSTTGYAEYVFIDLSNDVKASVEDSNNAADYLFLLKYTGNKTTSGEDTYFKYKVVIDGEETEKFVEESLTGKDGAGMLFRNVKENSKGYITGATKFDDAAKRDIVYLSGDVIDFNSDTLDIGGADYIIADSCKVTLALGKNANLDLVNEGDDYTLYNQVSARTAAGRLNGYKVDGAAYVTVDDDGSNVATSIYIWVDSAEETSGKKDDIEIDAEDFDVTVSTLSVTEVLVYDKANASDDEIYQAVYNELSKKGTISEEYMDGSNYKFVIGSKTYTWDGASIDAVKVSVSGDSMLVDATKALDDLVAIPAKGYVKVTTDKGGVSYKAVDDADVTTNVVNDGYSYETGFYAVTKAADSESATDDLSAAIAASLYVKEGDDVTITVTLTTEKASKDITIAVAADNATVSPDAAEVLIGENQAKGDYDYTVTLSKITDNVELTVTLADYVAPQA